MSNPSDFVCVYVLGFVSKSTCIEIMMLILETIEIDFGK